MNLSFVMDVKHNEHYNMLNAQMDFEHNDVCKCILNQWFLARGTQKILGGTCVVVLKNDSLIHLIIWGTFCGKLNLINEYDFNVRLSLCNTEK